MTATPARPVFRFAPSPNGRLHLGHAYSALFTFMAARRTGGDFLLRIEDIDTARARSEFIDGIYQDLRWLGLDWPEPVMIQSQRFDAYEKAAGRLRAMGLLYPCFCSRAQIAAASQATDPDGAPLYPGTCRHLRQEQVADRQARGESVQWRLHNELARAIAGPLSYRMAQPAPQDATWTRNVEIERWGDVVIQRKDTPASYHLAVVVDDAAQQVTHVTRGRDMEPATDIHVLLQHLLSLPTPLYTFHELILDDQGRKLSKSRGSPSIAAMREAGVTADEIRARAHSI